MSYYALGDEALTNETSVIKNNQNAVVVSDLGMSA